MAGPSLPLAQTPAPDAGVARPSGTVTFLFTDIEGSTRLWEQHPEAMRAGAGPPRRPAPRRRSRRTGATSSRPSARALLRRLRHAPRTPWPPPWPPSGRCAPKPGARPAPLRVRMALHTGEAEERDGDYFGPPLNRCARLLAVGARRPDAALRRPPQELVRDAAARRRRPARPGRAPPARTWSARSASSSSCTRTCPPTSRRCARSTRCPTTCPCS